MSSLVGKKAPDFTAAAVLATGEIVNDFNLTKTLAGKYGLVFFYPLDFTFVCPSELIALDHRMQQFKALNVEVLAVSIDSQFTHNAWRNTAIDQGGIGSVNYTLVADVKHEICRAYGVEHVEAGVALRGAFIVDKQGMIRAQIVNDLPLGRSIEEIVRLFDALQYHEVHGEVCPAGWQKGKAGMKASPQGVADYLATHGGDL